MLVRSQWIYVSIDNLCDIMIKYYKANIMVSAEQININTVVSLNSGGGSSGGQSSGEFEQQWHEDRRRRITVSNVGQIAKCKLTSYKSSQ